MIETRTCEIFLDTNGIVRCRYKYNVEENLEDARKNLGAASSFAAAGNAVAVIDLREVKMVDRGARRLYSGPETAKTFNAVALLVDSPVSTVIGNFMIGLEKMPIPTRLFRNEEKAVAWVLEYKT